VNSLDD